MHATRLILIAVVAQLLVASALGYYEMALSSKPNVSLAERHESHRRSDSPLGGGMSRVGYYFVRMKIGSQTFRVDIDTGSSTLYIVGPYCTYIENGSPCTYAESYYTGSAPYKSCTSGCWSCQKSACLMRATYGDGTKVYGAVKNEKVTLGDYSATAPVAISYLQSQAFAENSKGTHMDGLWGMAYSVFNGGQPTVMDQLVSAGMPNIFSICLSDNGGYLVMGGINTAYHTGDVYYTPITTQDYYTISVSSIVMDGDTVTNNMPKTILDSGTTFSYVPSDIYLSMAQTLRDAGMSRNFFVSSADDAIPCARFPTGNLPNIIVNFPKVGGGTFALTFTTSEYLISCGPPSNGIEYFAFGFAIGSDDLSILGDSFMRPYNSIFDREHKQIGFAVVSSSCSGTVALNTKTGVGPGEKSPFSSAPSRILTSSSFSLLFVLIAFAAIVFF